MKNNWQGLGAGPGHKVGKVFVFDAKKQSILDVELPTGDYILVTRFTRPDLVSLVVGASGLVTDIGGLTCHAAVISRELDIPCVVNTKDFSLNVKTGDFIEIDGDSGIVKILN